MLNGNENQVNEGINSGSGDGGESCDGQVVDEHEEEIGDESVEAESETEGKFAEDGVYEAEWRVFVVFVGETVDRQGQSSTAWGFLA